MELGVNISKNFRVDWFQVYMTIAIVLYTRFNLVFYFVLNTKFLLFITILS